MSKNITIEVGVNNGQNTYEIRNEFPDCELYGFEPVPDLQQKLKEKFKNDPKIHLIEKAIDLKEGKQNFHLTTNDQNWSNRYGASSLFRFAKDIKRKWNRRDFVIGKTITVETTPLSSFLDTLKFDKIRFLECDAQGNDINVLRSLGPYVNRLMEGQIEVALSIELYEGIDNTLVSALKWIRENNFQVVGLTPDMGFRECNLRFAKLDYVNDLARR